MALLSQLDLGLTSIQVALSPDRKTCPLQLAEFGRHVRRRDVQMFGKVPYTRVSTTLAIPEAKHH